MIMKTIKHFLLTVATLLCSISASAYDFKVDGIYYYIISEDDLTVAVTYEKYDNYYRSDCSGAICIPDTVAYRRKVYSVTKIADNAFNGCSGLTSVVIGNNVTNIDKYAFYNCSGLTSVTIGNNVKSIGVAAFDHCKSLISVTIPDNVTSIGNYAFNGCSNLLRVTIGYNVENISGTAFDGCGKLKTVINRSVLDIDDLGSSATKIISVDGDSIDGFDFGSIGDDFYLVDYKGEEHAISLPANYKGKSYSIAPLTFYNNSSLVSVDVPNSVTSIVYGAFAECN